MIIDITRETHSQIRNPVFAKYAVMYLDIYDNFMDQVKATGIEIYEDDDGREVKALQDRLRRKGAVFGNCGRSIYANAISPSCVACRKGIGSATFFISLQCHRDCYYCFNPNQVEYDYYRQHTRDVVGELNQIQTGGQRMNHIALTGGEPLLHVEETLAFFERAHTLFPGAFKRLYTCGDHANREILERLGTAGLNEIRFSIREHDSQKAVEHTLERIALATEIIPRVMVEMPVLPDSEEMMKDLLVKLDRIGIHSINLLEFCYPLLNAPEFNRRSFKIKKQPYQTLYNYWYAGGVPVAGSEMTCLGLLEFALEAELSMGLHYCSLENKLTGQNYQQNHLGKRPAIAVLSEDDYLLKSAKVFGRDIIPTRRRLRENGYTGYERNKQHNFLEFHIDQIPTLNGLRVEVGISTATIETRQDGEYIRELKVDLAYPDSVDPDQDI